VTTPTGPAAAPAAAPAAGPTSEPTTAPAAAPAAGRAGAPAREPGAALPLRPFVPTFVAVVALHVVGGVAGLVPLLAVVELGRELLSPGPVGGFDPDRGHVRAVVIAGALGLLVRLVCAGTASGIAHALDGRVQLAFRRQLAGRLGRAPIGWLSRRRTGELAKVVGEDVSAVHPFVAHTPGELVSAFVVPLVSLVYLVTVDWRMALVTPRRVREQKEFDAAMGRISSAVVEFVQGIAVVKACGGADRAHRRFRAAADDFVTTFTRWVGGVSGIAAGMQLAVSPPFVLVVVLAGGAAVPPLPRPARPTAPAGHRAAVHEGVERLMAGRTVVMVAHRARSAHRADRVVLLDGGRVTADGTHADLLRRDGRYAAFWDVPAPTASVGRGAAG
jgi:ATP-binding cassette subfamily B protein IrtA